MKQRLKTFSLAFMLVFAPLGRAVRGQTRTADAWTPARVRSEVTKRIANQSTRVKLKLLSGEELQGRIDQAEDKGFTIVADKTGKSVRIAYSEVSGVQARGLSTGMKIGIIAAVTVGLVVTVAAMSRRNFDPFKHGVLR